MRILSVFAVGATLAAGAACSESSPGTPPGPDRITINGKVVDGDLQPLAGLPVWVTGHAQMTTAANGRFSVSDVETPYDVATALTGPRFAVVYAKLTRDDPVLMLSITRLATPQTHYGTISGTVSGGAGFPETHYHRTGLLFASPEATYSASADHMGAYQMSLIDWRGSSTTAGTMHALQWRVDSATQRPVEYTGYGTRTGVVVPSGGNATGQDVQLAPVAPLTISGTVAVPDGYEIVSRTLRAGFGPAPTAPPVWTLLGDNSTASDFSYVAPNLPGAVLTLQVTANTPAGFSPRGTATRTVTSANAGALSISVPPGPELVAPNDGATGVTVGTTLAWRGPSGAVYTVVILEDGVSNPTRFHVITADTTALIPNLSALGFPLATAASYTWAVFAAGPFANLDAAAGSTSFFQPGDGSSGGSGDRRFTTAP